MLGRIVKMFSVVILLKTGLFATVDLDPKYLRLFTDENGSGIWQMVGVAGFYNNIYGVEFENVDNEYTSFYCENNLAGSIIRTKKSLVSPYNDMIGKYWLFSITVSEKLKDPLSLSPLVVDIIESNISCDGIQLHGLTSTVAAPLFINTQTISEPVIEFHYPNNGAIPSIVFSLDYNSSRIYEVNLVNGVAIEPITLDVDLLASTDQKRINNMSVAKQPINEIVDLYLNDNPSFGSADTNYSNYNRDAREYLSSNHQVPIDKKNFISDHSELKIYSYDNFRKEWLLYNSKNGQVSSNDFTELQAGKGYWIKYDFQSTGNFYLKTLDLNSSLFNKESNLTITSGAGIVKKYDFINSNIDTVISVLNENNLSDVNISAVKTADNSILIVAQTSSTKPKIKETTANGNIFLNIGSTDSSFWNTQDIKSGLVLGDSSIVLTSQSVYSTIAQQGWNLLTLPTSSIRRAVTGLIVDWNVSNGYADFTITDEFSVNKIKINPLYKVSDRNASESAKRINKAILDAQISGDLTTSTFNVRAIPVGETNSQILFISDDKFKLSTSATFGKITNFNGDLITTASSNYGEYALLFQPNLESQFIKDGHGQFEINDIKIDITTATNSITNLVSAINSSTAKVKAYPIDHDINGSINNDGSDYILLTSQSAISIKDTTYTTVYSYSINREGNVSVHLFNGTDIGAELKKITVLKDNNFSSSKISLDFNSLYFDNLTNKNIQVWNYIVDVDGNGSIDGNETEYIILTSPDSSNIILRESVFESNVTEDSLKEILNYDKNVTSLGSIIKGVQANNLAKSVIDKSLGKVTIIPTILDITANPFITDDLLASNSLITLSKAFSGEKRYVPTMIIGSESDITNDVIYWKTLSPVQKMSNWYNKYNLFSTNNQKAYWVYLADYDVTTEKGISILSGDAVADYEKPIVTKKYIRTFDNELNISHNYFNIEPKVSIKGVSEDINNLGTADKSSVYVVANLVGVSDSLANLDFKMPISSEPFSASMSFSTYIKYSDVKDLNNSLTSIKITATDGRLYTDEFSLAVDVKKPSKPLVAFQKDATGDMQSTVLYINSGDTGESDDTIKYLIFKDRIDDINGTAFNETGHNPSNFLLSIDKVTAKNGVEDICKNTVFKGDNLEFTTLIVVALDNEDTYQANFSDMSKINFIPMQGVHVLVHNPTIASEQDIQPYQYDDNCVGVGGLVDSDDKPKDSGVYLRSSAGEVAIAYKPYSTTTSTGTPFAMFVKLGTSNTIAKVTYQSIYKGKNFFAYQNGKIYKGIFLEDSKRELHDSDTNPYVLELISTSGQKIGE